MRRGQERRERKRSGEERKRRIDEWQGAGSGDERGEVRRGERKARRRE